MLRSVPWFTFGGIARLVMLSAALAAGLVISSRDVEHVAAVAGGDIRVINGLATSEVTIVPHAGACGTDYWHCDEPSWPNNTGLDVFNTLGLTAGTNAFFQSWTGSGYAFAQVYNHIRRGSLCPGVDVELWIPYPDSQTGTWIGSINSVQISPTIAFGTQFYLASYGWTVVTLGPVVGSAPGGGCPWQGIHYHQSGTHAPPHLYTNWEVENDDDPYIGGRQIDPTSNTNSNYLHWITY